MKKKFSKGFLQDLADPSIDEVVDRGRWTVSYRMVFEDKETEKHFEAYYRDGATEYQDEKPFEFDGKEIECDEVEEREVLVKQWVIVE